MPKLIPILDWECFEQVDTVHAIDLSACESWYPVVTSDANPRSTVTFALRSRPSMQPRFSRDTLLVINQTEQPADGDLILVKMRDTQQLSLRELLIDPPRWQLQPIVAGSDVIAK